VLLGYVVDFFAPAARLVVEVDGAHHARQRGADTRRDRALAEAGSRSCDCRRSSSSATCRRHYKPSCRRFGASAAAGEP
jgi:hypothetical protein